MRCYTALRSYFSSFRSWNTLIAIGLLIAVAGFVGCGASNGSKFIATAPPPTNNPPEGVLSLPPVLRGHPPEPPRTLSPEVVIEDCSGNGHILPQGTPETDLRISAGTVCIVDGSTPGGTYEYRNVNIWGGGVLKFADAKINFHAHSILVENKGTLEAGADAPAVGPITIWLYGSANDGIPPITCQSGPTCGVPQDIWDSNTNLVTKTPATGKCTPASSIAPSPVGDDCFYQYDVLDPGAPAGSYFSRKSLAVSYGGTLYLRGAKGIRPGPIDANPSDSGTSWVRLTDTLKGGETSFHVDRPVPTWGFGDHIVITSTDYLPSHSEEAIISSVTSDANGTKITLQDPVNFPHYGVAYDFSSLPATSGPHDDPNRPKTLPSRHLETRAAVALLTRSIMVASEGPVPVIADRSVDHFPKDSFYGGQTIMRQGFATYQVQGVEFYHLGQGGVIGRYPVHFHMDRKVPQPTVDPPFLGTYIADSSIHDSMTRFITVHATQGLMIARNVGYRSIGHGFYLEDATEINNKLYSNIGIEARAALDDDLNPRKVPGILAGPNTGPMGFPFQSDYDHPTIFWVMNAWNDLRYNVAVGAGACGACYWFPSSVNSGPSVYESWDSYASMQTNGRGGLAPFFNFTGNSCSTAMYALQTVGNTGPCLGVTYAGDPDTTKLHAIANPNPLPSNKYPAMDGDLRQHATVCDPLNQGDCSKVPICTGNGPNEAGCAVTTIDHFTSSFTWAQKNFAAVWLRGWWYLLRDSAITDVQSGGLTFVTGGGYTRSDAAQGFWNLSLRNLFVGNTQPINPSTQVPDNPAASNAGPFNPMGLTCPNPTLPYCISKADDTEYEIDSFSGAQRLISIYDGPSFEDGDAFMDVHVTDIGTLGDCKNGVTGNPNPAGGCQNLKWMNGTQSGVMQVPPTNNASNQCVLPNAAIAWKQPNGFYYPPAFHSQDITFQNVDIRHFVVQPLWQPGGFTPDLNAVQKTYCSWQPADFTQFTDVDRQTELSDDDGSITGLVSGTPPANEPSISVTKDVFYNAPLVTDECASEVPGGKATVDTSPYQYVTTAIYPQCSGAGGSCTAQWAVPCTNQNCYGVPLYRQYVMNSDSVPTPDNPRPRRPSIRMMGQATGQRSAMTVNHGSYYIDTTLDATAQSATPDKNIFLANQTYDIYLLYARPTTKQTYSMYIGKVTNAEAMASVVPGNVDISTAKYVFNADPSGNWITKSYDTNTGVLTVTIDLSGQTQTFTDDKPKFCQPQTYCSIQPDGSCGRTDRSDSANDAVCAWSNLEIDCPVAGCFGFSVTMPSGFVAEWQPNLPPPPIHFVGDPGSDPYFAPGTVQFYNVDLSISGAQCHYSNPPSPTDSARPIRMY
jgi:hypothetical protein